MGSKYEAAWRHCLPEDKVDAILGDLRRGKAPATLDVSSLLHIGARSTASWNHGITISRDGKVKGNAAHLNCLGRILCEKLAPGELLRLETRVHEQTLILTVQFDRAGKMHFGGT